MGPADRGLHASLTQKQSGGTVRYWRGQISPTTSSPVVTSSLRDPRDLTRRLVYLAGLLIGANDDGGEHGGTAGWNDGGMPVVTTAMQTQARTSIYELWWTYCAL